MRVSRYLFSSSFALWLHGLAGITETVRKTRRPLPPNHPMQGDERAFIVRTTEMRKLLRSGATQRRRTCSVFFVDRMRKLNLDGRFGGSERQGANIIAPAALGNFTGSPSSPHRSRHRNAATAIGPQFQFVGRSSKTCELQ